MKNLNKYLIFVGTAFFLVFSYQNFTYVIDKGNTDPSLKGTVRPVYKIGVIEVISPDTDLKNYRSCHVKLPSGNYEYRINATHGIGYGRGQIKHVNLPCQSQRIKGEKKEYLEINLEKYVHGKSTFKIDNLDAPIGGRSVRTESIVVWPISALGSYWEYLLRQAKISNTTLGVNPKFEVEMNAIIKKTDTLIGSKIRTDSDQLLVRKFFEEAIDENKIDLTKYDFVLLIQYQLSKNNPGQYTQFMRGFADKLKGIPAAYVPINIEQFLGNSAFLTAAHELGHAMFGLSDLYNGVYGKYPIGAHNWNINKWPARTACLMTKYFPKAISTSNNSLFIPWDPESDKNLDQKTEVFLRTKVGQYLLCATDIEIITNPNSIYAKNLFTKVIRPIGATYINDNLYQVKEGTNYELELYSKYFDPRFDSESVRVYSATLNHIPFLYETNNISNVKRGSQNEFVSFSEDVNVSYGVKNLKLTNKLVIKNDQKIDGLRLFNILSDTEQNNRMYTETTGIMITD